MQSLKKVFVIFLIILLVLTGLSSFRDGNKKIENNVKEILKETDSIEVLIVLDEKAEKGWFNKKNITDLKEELIEELGDRVGREFEYSPVFSANLTKEEITALSEKTEVKEIKEPRKFVALLQNSTGVINSSLVNDLSLNNEALTGKGQSVCVLDTGINYSHLDLANNYLLGYDFVNNDNDPYDDNGHGTHVAGIVAANGSIKGVAPEAGLVIGKVLDANGDGTDPNINAGIEWCVDNAEDYNISVISMSLGTDWRK